MKFHLEFIFLFQVFLYFYFRVPQVLFTVKIDLSPSFFKLLIYKNSKSCNFRSRRCLISHLVKSPHEETEAQKGEVISQDCRDAQRQRQV